MPSGQSPSGDARQKQRLPAAGAMRADQGDGVQVVLFADALTRQRLRSMIEAWGDTVVAEGSAASEILAAVPSLSPDLLVLDADFDFRGATQIARVARRKSPVLVAFLSPIDPIVGDVLQGIHPIGFLPRDFDRGDVGSLLAGARSEADAAPAAEAPRARSGPAPGDRRLELVALGSMLIAVAIGYFLPDGLPIFERAGHKSYYVVIGLAVISVACLLAARRPLAASVQGALIVLVTILPTQN